MAIKLYTPEDVIPVESITVMIYAPAGVGKTTLANMASKPFTFAFDPGIYRASNRKHSAVVETWQDVLDFIADKNNLADYDTIVIDTAGKAMEYLGEYVITKDPKNKKKDGSLSLSGFGALKQDFTNFLKKLQQLKKDVIFIAHDKEVGDGDTSVKRPDVTGSSLQILIRDTDLIGYMSVNESGERTVRFSPSENYIGKDCAGFGSIKVPDLTSEDEDAEGSMQWILNTAKSRLSEMTQAQKDLINQIQNIKNLIETAETLEDFTSAAAEIKEVKNTATQIDLANKLVEASKNSKTVEFNADAKTFVEAGKVVEKETKPESAEPESAKPESAKAEPTLHTEEPKEEGLKGSLKELLRAEGKKKITEADMVARLYQTLSDISVKVEEGAETVDELWDKVGKEEQDFVLATIKTEIKL